MGSGTSKPVVIFDLPLEVKCDENETCEETDQRVAKLVSSIPEHALVPRPKEGDLLFFDEWVCVWTNREPLRPVPVDHLGFMPSRLFCGPGTPFPIEHWSTGKGHQLHPEVRIDLSKNKAFCSTLKKVIARVEPAADQSHHLVEGEAAINVVVRPYGIGETIGFVGSIRDRDIYYTVVIRPWSDRCPRASLDVRQIVTGNRVDATTVEIDDALNYATKRKAHGHDDSHLFLRVYTPGDGLFLWV